MRRNLVSLTPESGANIPWLGVNFWSRVGGPRMWVQYDAATVAEELQVLSDHGLTLTRSFFYWPDFMPTPDAVDETLLDRFGDFLDLHTAAGLGTIPTLIVGHMSGENWDPPWRGGRDLYTDVWMVGRQAWFGEQVARRFAGHPAVVAWIVTNEMPIYGGTGTVESVTTWAQLVVQGLRAGGATQPISLGDGAWTVELSGVSSGYRLRELTPLIDWVGPHIYPMGTDPVRLHLRTGFVCDLATSFGLPVVLEEFGASSDFISDDHLGAYYRQVLHNSLLGGSTGWVAWNNTDFDDLIDEPPYSHHPFELHFGVTDSRGAPKDSLREMAAFASVLAAVEPHRCERAPTDVGIVVPAHVDSEFPFTDPRDQETALAGLEQAYLAAREAGTPAGFIRESAGIGDDCRLYLVPSCKQLTGPGWRRLERLAADGATVYVSYSPGGTDNQRGPWYAGLNDIFGVRHLLRYGMVDPIAADRIRWTLDVDFGGLKAGETVEFTAGGNANLRAYLPVEAVDAEVLATDGEGRPALLRRRVGTGAIILCTYPIEAMAAATAHVNPEQTWRLYAALAREAGVTVPIEVDDPRVLVDCLDREDGVRFVWLVSQSASPLTITPRSYAASDLVDLHTGEPIDAVDLPPFGVRVLRMTNLAPPG
ncbi:MAG TPA: cellulase family glycosylhydrolase [Micromonosporaceae bacterium]|nr:cellulase family glycosylhydrolase [Micromonosporaceae bacterium]